MLFDNNDQIKLYDDVLESIVRADHPYRKTNELVNFRTLLQPYHKIYSGIGRPTEYSIETMFKCILIQFMEDLSDRQLEQYLQENNAAKWFCGFGLLEKTPDHSQFGIFRNRLGVENLKELHNSIVESLRKKKMISDTFTFIDTTAIVSKMALWEERDKVIKDGFITGVSVKAGNENDWDMFKNVMPLSGAVLADKIFDTNELQEFCKAHGLHSMIIKKNNRKDKNRDLDRFLTKLRSPFERMFTHFKKKKNDGGHIRTHFRGLLKVEFQILGKAIGSNLKRLEKVIDKYREAYGIANYACIVS